MAKDMRIKRSADAAMNRAERSALQNARHGFAAKRSGGKKPWRSEALIARSGAKDERNGALK